MSKNKHLTLIERQEIERLLMASATFGEIARSLDKNSTTISKEIRGHLQMQETGAKNGAAFNPCSNRASCNHKGDLCAGCHATTRRCALCYHKCYLHCPDFIELPCPRLQHPPYSCNNCGVLNSCTKRKFFYRAKAAQAAYESKRSESRAGISITPQELERLDSIVSPLLKKGHSIHHICVNNADEIMLDERTIYNYISRGILTAGAMDLPRKVRYRPRKIQRPVRIDKACFEGRTYSDFLKFMEENPEANVVEIDSVEGKKGGKVLLTICFRSTLFMLAFLRPANTARSVAGVFNSLDRTLGREKFKELFPVILTDRGSEFTNPLAIECDANGEIRTRVFFCDPRRSEQKGTCEVTHEMIRRVLPKGISFDTLEQADIDLMMSHINSYTRKKLNDRSASQLFSFLYGEEILALLNIQQIAPNAICLTPKLLKAKQAETQRKYYFFDN